MHLSAFYRSYIIKEVYADIGFYSSIGYIFPIDEKIAYDRFIGGFLAIYYGFEKIKFGHELQIGKMDVEFYYVTKSNPSILITPIIVRFQL
ncbi:MAG: hypothetical protein K8R58_06100 [Bacteroidales bacterium]|nr:hypothetical protein [Bacteroidales bacterium]